MKEEREEMISFRPIRINIDRAGIKVQDAVTKTCVQKS